MLVIIAGMDLSTMLQANNCMIFNYMLVCASFIRQAWQTQKTPADTLGAIKKLRRLRRKLNRNRNAPDVDETKSLISRCRKILEELTTRDRNNSWSKLTKEIEQNPKKFWRIAKTLRGGSQEMPALKADNGKDFVLNTQEKAEIMATKFESYHQPGRNPRNSDNRLTKEVEKFLNRTKHNSDIRAYDPITTDEVLTVWKRFKPFKTPGKDGIPIILLKKLPIEATRFFVNLLNKCLELMMISLAKTMDIGKSCLHSKTGQTIG